ncbi:hypothetical protein KC343_g7694 [Hortaea werneckii]|uniref:F-box domain-containing protein n=1 Tax=Hortaea werneckii TaxID=91943 RepID=A0A3M7GWP0_HORWE|nr:hypothetical protein KC352_g18560 [Hortaea werneckii]KAI7563087.1 hypothetical protein KC317_g7974 [Hortaea werneckii]KAI7612955.1 hypothetical protein KC346_g7563 [Hortaea werneckii]KAI7622288.1 hypothetical protein KC343_g7694 [Hortaea werneckii]KAI7664326.1 hypothetical protein KC319_g7518 [Hortaea werneckii]
MEEQKPSKLLTLPAELRLRIYTYVLHFSYPLYRPLRTSIIHSWHYFSEQSNDNGDSKINANNLADTALLLTNRQIHHEAKDCFYELNSFRVSFNHLCSCQNIFPYPAFDESLVRRLEIRSFLPRSNSLISKDSSSSIGSSSISSLHNDAFDASDASYEEEEEEDEEGQEAAYINCRFCQNSGMGLIEYLLHDLPKLHAATVAFEDIFTFSESIGPILRKLVPPCQSNPRQNDENDDDTSDTTNNDPPRLVSDEIGTLRLEGLPRGQTLEFHLPSLTHAWRSLAGTEQHQRRVWDGDTSHRGSSSSQNPTHTRLPGQKILSRALEYLHFEANSYDRVPAALRRFFVVVVVVAAPRPAGSGSESDSRDSTHQTAQLHFRSLPDGRERRAGFTIALARELAKVFEDDGGAGSIEWVPLDAEPEVPVWRFGLDRVDVQEDEREAEWEGEDGDGVWGSGGRSEEEEMEIWRLSRRDPR